MVRGEATQVARIVAAVLNENYSNGAGSFSNASVMIRY